MITETETAFLAVIRAFLTEEKASPAEIQGADRKTMESSVCPRGTAFAAVSGLRCCGKNTGICRTSGRASQTGKNAGNAECFAAGFAYSAVSFR